MKKIIFYIVGIVVIVGLVYFYFNLVSQPNGGVNMETGLNLEDKDFVPWVEVHVPGVFVQNNDSVINNLLKTGDEIKAGDTVISDETGLATVHFSDGSVFRLDVSSKVILRDFNFKNENNTLGVKLFLVTGRVWSKIISLATPESYWEVETDNAVSAVRGTAFGVEYLEGKTFIVGSQNEVVVSVVDPDNKQSLINNTAIVGENKVLEILDEDLVDLRDGKIKLNDRVQDAKLLILERDWIVRARSQDNQIDSRVLELRNGGLLENEVHSEMKKDDYEKKKSLNSQTSQVIILSNDSEMSTEEDEIIVGDDEEGGDSDS